MAVTPHTHITQWVRPFPPGPVDGQSAYQGTISSLTQQCGKNFSLDCNQWLAVGADSLATSSNIALVNH